MRENQRTDRQTDRQTDTVITVLRSSVGGRSNERVSVVAELAENNDVHSFQRVTNAGVIAFTSPIITDINSPIRYDTIRYDAICYFNVRSKADMSQLNLPHGTDN